MNSEKKFLIFKKMRIRNYTKWIRKHRQVMILLLLKSSLRGMSINNQSIDYGFKKFVFCMEDKILMGKGEFLGEVWSRWLKRNFVHHRSPLQNE
jgi:hypothetical protein